MIGLAIGLQLADLLTFGIASGFLPVVALERNPLMVAAFLAAGLVGVGLVKLALLGAMFGLRSRLTTRRPALAYGLIAAGGAIGLTANLSAMVTLG